MKTLRNFTQHRMGGFSLVELMVAMGIGLVLIIGASKVYLEGHQSYNNNESISRMQEAARYAMSVLENDIRMSNFWGEKSGSGGIAVLVAAGTAADNCGRSFKGLPLMMEPPLSGTNNGYLPAPYAGTCTPFSAAVGGSDTITVLRAGTGNSGASWRLCSKAATASLSNAACPAGFTSNDFLIHSYYVDRDSRQTGVPSLRRHALIAGPTMQDQEIMPGIEDFQIQFGVDPANPAINASVKMYVNPNAVPVDSFGDPIPILSVRLWLLVREDAPETSFIDNLTYELGDRVIGNGITYDLNVGGRAYRPSASPDTSGTSIIRYRRLLVSKTIQPRNVVQ